MRGICSPTPPIVLTWNWDRNYFTIFCACPESTLNQEDAVARIRELENTRNFLTGSALTSWLDLLLRRFSSRHVSLQRYTLTLIVIAALPVLFGASWIITPLLHRKLEDRFALGAENQAFLVETVTSMETLRAKPSEPFWQRVGTTHVGLCQY